MLLIIFLIALVAALIGTKIIFSLQGDDVIGAAPIMLITLAAWITVAICLLIWFVRAVA